MVARYYVGLMSGTSLDAVDAALVCLSGEEITLLETLNKELSDDLKQQILGLCQSGDDEINRMKALDRQLGKLFAETTLALLHKSGKTPNQITAIGSHGQTIRHCPNSTPHFSLQIGDPNTIAEETRITTVADFRQRDVAAGGQGAPLLPLFHKQALMRDPNDVVLNIGGISNITFVDEQSGLLSGFDTGPGNVLIDYWVKKSTGKSFDNNGEWGKSGKLQESLLTTLLNEPYLRLQPPKSTGRELFNSTWLEKKLAEFPSNCFTDRDIQNTLIEFTAISAAREIKKHLNPKVVVVCGGGARNSYLLNRISYHLPSESSLITSDDRGIPAEWVEAMAFGWFAHNTLTGTASNVPSCTGAKGARILGGIYLS
jgi:anhydro-N-acetylmuramic acid kinase